MKITRRVLLRSGAGVVAISVLPRFSVPSAHAHSTLTRQATSIPQSIGTPQATVAFAPRMRWEDFVQDPTRLASLIRGVEVMKSRAPSDPTSWFYQSAIHAVTPEAVTAAAAVDADVAKVDQVRFWNQCPHTSASHSADFLIWHRAYLYYFERILRDAAQDPTFSLPYWNYTDGARRGFPREFAIADPDPLTQLPRNPLFDHRREQAFMFGLYTLSERVVATTALFNEVNFFGATEDSGLAGGVFDNDGRTRGLMERQPHDLIHVAIGGAIGTGDISSPNNAVSGLMASVPTAAFDPIFWVHHANIDRLWTVWECLDSPPRQWGALPDRAWLEESPWSFHDYDLSIQEEQRLYYLHQSNLAVSYDTDDPNCTPLSTRVPLAAGAQAEAGNPQMGDPSNIRAFAPIAEVGRSEQAIRVSPSTARTIVVPLEPVAELADQDVREAILAAPDEAPLRLFLELHDVVVEGVTSVGFDVFAVLGEEMPTDRAAPTYLGTLSMFGTLPADMSVHVAHGNGHSENTDQAGGMTIQRFDITRLMAVEGFDPAELRIRIAPFDLLTPVEGQPRLRRPVGVTIDEIHVKIVEGIPAP